MKKTLLSLLIAVGLFGSASAQVPSGDLANGLVAFWQLNGNANDSVGGYNGTINGTTPTTDQFGNQNGALSFNGSNNDISVSSPPRLFGLSSFTISLMANLNAACLNKPTYLLGEDNGPGTQNKWTLGYTAYQASYILNFNVGATGNGVDFTAPVLNGNYIGNGWHLFTYSQTGNTGTIYIDGDAVSSSVGNISIPSDITAPLTIGSAENGGWVDGSISDVGIWNTALSSSQVSSLYTLQSAPEPSTYALFGIGAIATLIVLRRKRTA